MPTSKSNTATKKRTTKAKPKPKLNKKSGHVTFVLRDKFRNSNTMIGGYTDRYGNPIDPKDTKTSNGKKVDKKMLKFSTNGKLKIPAIQEQLIDVIRKHKNCKGSPNQQGGYYEFYEYDPVKAAEEYNKQEETRENAIFRMGEAKQDYEKLRKLSAIAGCYHESEEVMIQKLREYVKGYPEQFLDNFDKDGELTQEAEVMALVKLCVHPSYQVIKQKQGGYVFDKIPLGTSYEQIVGKLTNESNQDLLANVTSAFEDKDNED